MKKKNIVETTLVKIQKKESHSTQNYFGNKYRIYYVIEYKDKKYIYSEEKEGYDEKLIFDYEGFFIDSFENWNKDKNINIDDFWK